MECSIAIFTCYLHRPQLFLWIRDWCQLLSWTMPYRACCVIYCELHAFINMCNLVPLHRLIWATERWMHWSGFIRTAIYGAIDSCLCVFRPISAEIPNVNNNNLQVFKRYVITFSLWGCCWKACSLKHRESVVMVWMPCNEKLITELVMTDSLIRT